MSKTTGMLQAALLAMAFFAGTASAEGSAAPREDAAGAALQSSIGTGASLVEASWPRPPRAELAAWPAANGQSGRQALLPEPTALSLTLLALLGVCTLWMWRHFDLQASRRRAAGG